MSAAFAQSVGNILRPGWLANPVLGKEMRATSRRGRFYILRASYLAALTLFIALVWMSQVERLSAGPQSASMADAGKRIIGSMSWFQFVAAQFIAVLVLSTSISGEITRRTLPIIMTTPVDHSQIVWGKLMGGVGHVMILLACSLPLMAIVRVFGGVPWDFVVTSLCITVSAAIFAGALSIYFSVIFRQPFAAVAMSLVLVGIYQSIGFAVMPLIAIFMVVGAWERRRTAKARYMPAGCLRSFLIVLAIIFSYGLLIAVSVNSAYNVWALLNPVWAIYFDTENMMTPGSVKCQPEVLWLNCAVMLWFSYVVMMICAKKLKSISYTKAWGEEPPHWVHSPYDREDMEAA